MMTEKLSKAEKTKLKQSSQLHLCYACSVKQCLVITNEA